MNFLADEGVERQIVDSLRSRGHTVLFVAEMLPGIDDDVVLDQANKSSSILIPSDKDFGELVFRQKRIHQGVILIRLNGQSEKMKATTVINAVAEFGDQLSGAFSVVSSGTVRIRRKS